MSSTYNTRIFQVKNSERFILTDGKDMYTYDEKIGKMVKCRSVPNPILPKIQKFGTPRDTKWVSKKTKN